MTQVGLASYQTPPPLSPPHLVSGIPPWQEWPRGPQGSPQVEAPPPEVEAVAGASPGPAPEPGRDHSAPGAARTRSALLGWAPAAVPREREGAREQVAHSPLGPLPPQLTYPSVPPQTTPAHLQQQLLGGGSGRLQGLLGAHAAGVDHAGTRGLVGARWAEHPVAVDHVAAVACH